MSNDSVNAWEYTGEIYDPAQAPLTAAVYTCGTCGSLSVGLGRETHDRWHASVAPDHVTLVDGTQARHMTGGQLGVTAQYPSLRPVPDAGEPS